MVHKKISRSYFTQSYDYQEGHLFGDSSKQLIRAVAFSRANVTSTSGWQKPDVAFVLSIACVAHVKVMTLTKQEQQAPFPDVRLKN